MTDDSGESIEATPLCGVRKTARLTMGRDQLLNMLEFSIDPLVLALSLWVVAFWFDGSLAPRYVILSLIVFSLTFPGSSQLTQSPWSVLRHVVIGWLAISGLLFIFVSASGYLQYFDRALLVTWWWVAPSTQLVAHFILRLAAPAIIEMQGQHASCLRINQ